MAALRQVLLVALFAAVVECNWESFDDFKVPLPRLSDLIRVLEDSPLPFGVNIFNAARRGFKNGFLDDNDVKVPNYFQRNQNPSSDNLRERFGIGLNKKPQQSGAYDNNDDKRACNCGNNAPENTDNHEKPVNNFNGKIDGINKIDVRGGFTRD